MKCIGGAGTGAGLGAGSFLGSGLATTLRFAIPSAALFGSVSAVKSLVEEGQQLELVFNRIEAQLDNQLDKLISRSSSRGFGSLSRSFLNS